MGGLERSELTEGSQPSFAQRAMVHARYEDLERRVSLELIDYHDFRPAWVLRPERSRRSLFGFPFVETPGLIGRRQELLFFIGDRAQLRVTASGVGERALRGLLADLDLAAIEELARDSR